MFLKNSRYYGLETVTAKDRHGRGVSAIKRRTLGKPAAEAYVVQGPDKLDVMAEQKCGDATKFWHIADANTELEANELTRVAARVIKVPTK